jgi:hypothetical protein
LKVFCLDAARFRLLCWGSSPAASAKRYHGEKFMAFLAERSKESGGISLEEAIKRLGDRERPAEGQE